MEENPEVLAQMSNYSFLRELDLAEAKLNDELKSMVEQDEHEEADNPVSEAAAVAQMEQYNDDDDDDPDMVAALAKMSNHSLLQELDQAAAILDSELQAIADAEQEHNNLSSSFGCGGDVSHLFDDEDDDDLTDELASLEYSKVALQQELDRSAMSFDEYGNDVMRKEDDEFKDHTPEINFHLSFQEDDSDTIPYIQTSFDDHESEHFVESPPVKLTLNIEDVSPIKFTSTRTTTSSQIDVNTNNRLQRANLIENEEDIDGNTDEDVITPRIQNTSVLHSPDNFVVDDDEDPIISFKSSPNGKSSPLSLLKLVTSPPSLDTSDVPTIIPTYSEDTTDQQEQEEHTEQKRKVQQQISEQEMMTSSHSTPQSRETKRWLHKRLFDKVSNNNQNNEVNVLTDKKRSRLFSRTRRSSKATAASPSTSTLPTVSENATLQASAIPTSINATSKTEENSQVLLSREMCKVLVGTVSSERPPNPMLIFDERERLVISKMMKMLASLEAKTKDQEKRERKLLRMLRDAWHARNKLLSDHKEDIQNLESRHKHDMDQGLQQFRQEYEERLAAVTRERDALKKHVHQVQEEYQAKLDEANHRADLAQKHLEQAQRGFEQKWNEYQKNHELELMKRDKLKQEMKNRIFESESSTLLVKEAQIKQLEARYELSRARRLETERELDSIQNTLCREKAKKRTDLRLHIPCNEQDEESTQVSQPLGNRVEEENRVQEVDSKNHSHKQLMQVLQEHARPLPSSVAKKANNSHRMDYACETLNFELELSKADTLNESSELLTCSSDTSSSESDSRKSPVEQRVRDQLKRLRKSFTPKHDGQTNSDSIHVTTSSLSINKGPVEQRVRDQVDRIRKSLTPKHGEDSVVPVFWSENSSNVSISTTQQSATTNTRTTTTAAKYSFPKRQRYASKLRPPQRTNSNTKTSVDKENNGGRSGIFLPKRHNHLSNNSISDNNNTRRGLGVRRGLGIR